MFRIFVVGTDTGIGKTETAAALLSLLADAGERPAPFKPYESGCRDLRRPADALRLKEAARSDDPLERISVHRFKAPVAPGVAAHRLGRRTDFGRVLAALKGFKGRSLVAEAAGGLLVPIDDRRVVLDLVEQSRLPALLVARAGLGTLNHTALSLDALRSRRIPVRAVLLAETRAKPDSSVLDNAEWIQRRHAVRVLGPVPYRKSLAARRLAFRRVLQPLLTS